MDQSAPSQKRDHLYKKGQSGNLKGRPKKAPELKTVQYCRHIDIERELNRLWNMSASELKDAINPEGKTCGELLLARAFYNAIKKADERSTNAILDRMVGKVKENIRLETNHTVKIEHVKIHEIRQILQADPFLGGNDGRTIETTGTPIPAIGRDSDEAGNGEECSDRSNQDPS